MYYPEKMHQIKIKKHLLYNRKDMNMSKEVIKHVSKAKVQCNL